MQLGFAGVVYCWRGPAPYHFVDVPDEASAEIAAAAPFVTYGWGMIPVQVTLGGTSWTTSLWPKDDRYVVPLKVAVRRAEGVEEGDIVSLMLTLGD